MRKEFADVLRATTAVQVALFELEVEDVKDNRAMPALEICLNRLTQAVKRLKKVVA